MTPSRRRLIRSLAILGLSSFAAQTGIALGALAFLGGHIALISVILITTWGCWGLGHLLIRD